MVEQVLGGKLGKLVLDMWNFRCLVDIINKSSLREGSELEVLYKDVFKS